MSDDAPIRVLLAEDHTIVREGLRALLLAQQGIEVVGEAADGRIAIEQALELRPDVVVMDLNMPGVSGIDAITQLSSEAPECRVLVLSMHSSEEYIRPAIRAGASAYLLKGSGLSDLVAAIRAVARGEAFFSPAVAKVLLSETRRASSEQVMELTPREREVLRWVAEGRSSPEIARMLQLSVKTIEGHRSRIMSKLDVRNVAELVRHAIRLGLV